MLCLKIAPPLRRIRVVHFQQEMTILIVESLLLLGRAFFHFVLPVLVSSSGCKTRPRIFELESTLHFLTSRGQMEPVVQTIDKTPPEAHPLLSAMKLLMILRRRTFALNAEPRFLRHDLPLGVYISSRSTVPPSPCSTHLEVNEALIYSPC